MKIYSKEITLGDYNFKVAVDRDIVCDAFEKYPELMDFIFTNAGVDSNEVIKNAIKEKKLRVVLDSSDMIWEMVKFAFPKMLKKADKTFDTDNAPKTQELINYIEDNDVRDEFASAMFEFICSGFTPETTERKPKVKFVMK